jgi:hypothetical protein|nr:MAG TPA: internal head protein [Caudoviricetes sp.]
MGINSIVNKHLSTYGEAYGFKKVKKERKYSRVIQGECLAPVAYSVLQARAENMRLRTKLRASYYVASGEADTKKKLDWKMAKDALGDAKKNIENFIKLIIEAIKNAWKWITSNRSKWEQRLPKLEKHIHRIHSTKIEKPISVPDIKNIVPLVEELEDCVKSINEGIAKKNFSKGSLKDSDLPSTKLSKDEAKATKQITSATEAAKYFSDLKSIASKLGTAEDNLVKAKENLEKRINNTKREKDSKDLEKDYRKMLTLTNKAIADLQKTWGRLWQGAGSLLKINPVTLKERAQKGVDKATKEVKDKVENAKNRFNAMKKSK